MPTAVGAVLGARPPHTRGASVQVEVLRLLYNERVLIAAHSWGDNVARAFLHWMEEQAPGWVDKHIAVLFSCAGPGLGVPKAAASLLSGEMRESAQLSGLTYLIGESLLAKEDRTAVWRTWGSPLGMLPIGGTNVWGNASFAPDDPRCNVSATAPSFGCCYCPLCCPSRLP
jgi:phospholipid:diacylglycerol acyltransferase